jgi:hypothetical protein
MAEIAEKIDASSLLTAPSGDLGADFVKELEASAGLLLGSIMWFIRKAFGVSPIEELVKPIAGDWKALMRAESAWESAGLACDAVSVNFGALPGMTQDWEGDAAPAFRSRMTSLEQNYAKYGEGCTTLSQLTGSLVTVSKSTASTISLILGWIAEEVTQLVACASVPIAGWIAGGAKVAVSIRKYWKWIDKGYKAIKRVLDAVETFINAMYTLMTVLRSLATLLNTFSGAVSYYAGTKIDTASEKTFGTGPSQPAAPSNPKGP